MKNKIVELDIEQYEVLLKLSRSALHSAFVWNDHNFKEGAQSMSKNTAKESGLFSIEDANLFLTSLPSTSNKQLEARKKMKDKHCMGTTDDGIERVEFKNGDILHYKGMPFLVDEGMPFLVDEGMPFLVDESIVLKGLKSNKEIVDREVHHGKINTRTT